MPKMVRAKETFLVATETGRPLWVTAGELYAANNPVVKGREAMFEDLEDAVEQATAAPGEKRSVSTRRKKTATKTDDD